MNQRVLVFLGLALFFPILTNSAIAGVGESWCQATPGADWSARENLAVVNYKNKMWVLGGFDGSNRNDVWSTSDGVNWTRVTDSANWAGRRSHTAVVYDGKMWVMGGWSSGPLNDVWYSTDGITWQEATGAADWGARHEHSTIVYDSKMWVLGGANGGNEVWWSTNGVNWTRATDAAPGGSRSSYTAVAFAGKMWIVGGYTSGAKSDVWWSTDGVQWTQVVDPAEWPARAEHETVVYDERMWVFAGASGSALSDVWYSDNGADWTSATLTATWDARCSTASCVWNNSLWVLGGTTGTRKNDVWFTTALGSKWQKEVEVGPWGKRCGHTMIALNNRLWLLGGYDYDSGSGGTREVWSSADGVSWSLVTNSAPWTARSFHASTAYDAKMWVMGGYEVGSTRVNDVWWSSDGLNWTQATGAAGWSARCNHAATVHDGKMWVTGGFIPGGGTGDVWYSTNGSSWTQTTASAFPPRRQHACTTYQGRMWVANGYDDFTSQYRQDAWYSQDGITWNQATSSLPWGPTRDISLIGYAGNLWAFGGGCQGVWYSLDGANWASAVVLDPWSGRTAAGTALFLGSLWTAAGYRTDACSMTSIVYVNEGNLSGIEDGGSWATAFTTIQEGVDAAYARGGAQVWVAEGTYDEARPHATGALELKSGVYVYGGFAGTETRFGQRNLSSHSTTIDGSVARAGSAAYHVVIGANNSGIDGFTITGGNANGSGMEAHGGGLYAALAEVTVSNTIFRQNSSASWGGASTIVESDSLFTNCVFIDNTSSDDTVMMYDNCQATFINCTVANNTCGGFNTNDGPHGPSQTTIINSIVYGNTGVTQIYNAASCTTAVSNSNIQGGYAGTGNISNNPLFVGSTDVQLTPSSPCIDTATATGAPATDILGADRPWGLGYDMGAYEYTGLSSLAWSTYIGSADADESKAIAVDASGYSYIVGSTSSPGWASGGWQTTYGGGTSDAFVMKLSPSGAHVWSTYIGGAGLDQGSRICVDSSGNCYVVGSTSSTGWPSGGWQTTYGGGTSDGFVMKLNSSGVPLWSTYLGGTGADNGFDIDVDSSGTCVVSGQTASSGWVSGGWQTSYLGGGLDGFVVKLNTTGGHVWSTYIGGTDLDHGMGIATDSGGNIYTAGFTRSPGWVGGGWQTVYGGGSYDAFLLKMDSAGSHQWSTYLGGSGTDECEAVAVTADGNCYVVGETTSSGWVTNGWDTTFGDDWDGFAAKLDSDGTYLWSTYLGDTATDEGLGIALDLAGDCYVTGRTTSPGWVDSGWDISHNGGTDAYTVKLSAEGAHIWSTYLGGANEDVGYGIDVDDSGGIYVAGRTASPGWVSGGWMTTYGGGTWDGFVAKLEDLTFSGPLGPAAPTTPGATGIGLDTITWTWQDNASDETGFKVYDDPGAGPPTTLQTTTAADAVSWPHTGLDVNTQYAFQVAATNGGGDSDKTSNYTAWTLIEAVSGLTFSDVTATSITVGAVNTPSNLTSGISGLHFLNATEVTSSSWQQSVTPWISDGLSPNTEYTFNGKSRNGTGVETTPTSASSYTLAAVPTAPSVTSPGVHSLTVSIGTGDGNPAYTSYAIQVSPAVTGNTWVQADGTVGASAAYQTAAVWDARVVTGLAEYTSYSFTCIARNGNNVDSAPGPSGTGMTRDGTPPTGTVVINSGVGVTASLDVTLDLSADDSPGSGVAQMQFSNDDAVWSAPEGYAPTRAWTLAAGADGPRTVYVRYADVAGNWSGSFTAGITLDTSLPSGTIIINSGALLTGVLNVTLTLSASTGSGTITEMQFSNDNAAWSPAEPYATSKSWVLEAGPDGERTVYVKYKNSFELWSPPIPDTITLNTVLTAPIITTDGGRGPGEDFPTTASNVTLAGTCSPITAQIKINSSVTGVTYTPGTANWSFTGALRSGYNLFSVIALDGASQESEEDTIAVTRVKPSSMSLYVAGSTTVTLGSPITLRGSITPKPAGGAIVSFESRLPSGLVSNEIPESVGTGSTGAYTRVFYPTEASEGRQAWTIKATWPGDSLLYRAESAPVSVNVLKAQPTLLLSLNAASVPQNYDGLEAVVEFVAPLPDTLAGLREGRTIQLYARRPDGSSFAPLSKMTDADGKAVFTSTDFTLGGWTFDMAGTWQFRAFFAGNESFLNAASPPYDEPESVRLTVKDKAGYAVIVLGKYNAAGEGQAEHCKTTDGVYRSLRDRGIATEDIYYFRAPVLPLPPDIQVADTTPTEAEIGAAITTWARDKMRTSSAPLYVVFVDHGSLSMFYVYAGVYGPTSYITPSEMDGWLDSLDAGLIGYPAAGMPRVFVYGGCHSGSFIPALSKSGRVIVASALASQVSHRGVKDPFDDRRDGEAFTTEFFRNLKTGKSLRESFALSSQKMSEYTANATNGWYSLLVQKPVYDDNGDGIGTTGALSPLPGQDGALGHTLELGYGVNAAGDASWLGATPTVTLEAEAPMVALQAQSDKIPATGCTAWVEIKTPAYSGSTPIDDGNPPEDQAKAVELTRYDADMLTSDPDVGVFRWPGAVFGDAFDTPGTYKVFYFVRDGETDAVSTHLLTTVYRKTVNTPPPVPGLEFPADEAIAHTPVFFAWDEVSDPDGVSYRLEIAEDLNFSQGLIVRSELSTPYALLGPEDGILDLHTYYWRVYAVDGYGAQSADGTVRTFSVDNVNPAVPGVVLGRIVDTTDQPLSGAAVVATPGNVDTTSNTSGRFYFSLPQGTGYSLDVSNPGYEPVNVNGIAVESGRINELPPIRLSLTPVPVWSGFASQPQNLRKYTGEGGLLTVVPDCGVGAVTYLWKRQTSTKALEDGPATQSWFLTNLNAAQAGEYWCEVAYEGQTYTSDRGTVEVAAPLAIAANPVGGLAPLGAERVLSVETTGGYVPLTYHWMFNNEAIPGAPDAADFTLTNLQLSESGLYRVKVTDANGMTAYSTEVELSVTDQVVWNGFAAQPGPMRKYTGDTCTLLVQPSCGVGTLAYQWKRETAGKALENGPTAPQWPLGPLTLLDAGTYWCEVLYDGVVYESDHVTLEVANHLTITDQPAGANKTPGESHLFTVVTSGGYPPLTYQWFKDGEGIPESNESELELTELDIEDSGAYTVQITDGNEDNTTSLTAILVVAWGTPVTGILGVVAVVLLIAGLAIRMTRKEIRPKQ